LLSSDNGERLAQSCSGLCASGEMLFKQQKASTKPKGVGQCLVHQFSEDESVKERLDGRIQSGAIIHEILL